MDMVRKFFPIHASVIICTYRRDKVLVETVDQVLAQADGLAEIVIVDQKAQPDLATRELKPIDRNSYDLAIRSPQ